MRVPVSAHFLVLAAVCLLKYAPFLPVLYSVSFMAVLSGFLLIAEKETSDSSYIRFAAFLSLLALVIVWRDFPSIASAVLAGWAFRGISARHGFLVESPSKSFLAESVFASLVFVWASDTSLSFVSPWIIPEVVLLLILSRGFAARFKWGSSVLMGEAVSAALVAGFAGMDTAFVVFARNPFHTMLMSAILAYVLNGAGVLGRLSTWIFFIAGSLIFTFAGQEAFILFFLFTMTLLASERLWPDSNAEPLYNLSSIMAAGIAVYSIGAEDPFSAYLAVSGLFSASAFYAWGGMGAGGFKSFRGLIYGVGGAGIVSVSTWVSSFLPYTAMPVVLLGGASALLIPYFAVVLEDSERDEKWLVAATGALSAAFMFKMALKFLVGF